MASPRLDEPSGAASRADGASASERLEAFCARHPRALVAVVLLVALGLRAAHLLEFRGTPYFDHLMVDAEVYDERGWAIAQGDWLGGRIFYQDPLYPYFLGLLYRLAGHSYLAVYLVQSLLGVLLCPMTAAIARRLYARSPHRSTIAFLAGLLTAVYTPLVFYETLILKTSLGVFLSTAHLLAFLALQERLERPASGSRRMAVAAGTLLGLNLLNRGNYLLIAVLFAGWLLWRAMERSARSRSLACLGAYLGAVALVVLPVTVRNYVVGGEWVLITSQAGQNLYIGNNPTNLHGSYAAPPGVRPNPRFEETDFLALATAELGREPSPSEASRHFVGKTLRWMADEPAAALRLLAAKAMLWLSYLELADNYSLAFTREHFSRVLDLPLPGTALISLLGWAALVLALFPRRAATWLSVRGSPALGIAMAFVLVYSVSVVLFFVFGRYRLYVYPVLLSSAAGLLVWLPTEWLRLSVPLRLAALAPLVLSAGAVLRPYLSPGSFHWTLTDSAVEYYNLGSALMETGEIEEGRRYMALAADQENVRPEILEQIGVTCRHVGEHDMAERAYRALLGLNREYAPAWLGLGLVEAARGEHAQALASLERAAAARPDWPAVQRHLGSLHVKLGRPRLARAAYARFVELAQPESLETRGGYVDAAEVLLAAPDVESFRLGLRALRLAPAGNPASPAWLSVLLDLRLEGEKEDALLGFLQELVDTGQLDASARARVLQRLDEGPATPAQDG